MSAIKDEMSRQGNKRARPYQGHGRPKVLAARQLASQGVDQNHSADGEEDAKGLDRKRNKVDRTLDL